MAQIFLKVRELYKKEGGKFPDPILNADVAIHQPAAIRRWPNWRRRLTARRSPMSTDPNDQTSDQGGPATAGFCLAAGRRHHASRQLAVLRVLDRSRRNDAAPRN